MSTYAVTDAPLDAAVAALLERLADGGDAR